MSVVTNSNKTNEVNWANQQIANSNESEEILPHPKLPQWMHTKLFKGVKLTLCIFCFPLIYFIGKLIIQILK